jgi:hypothetical protein
MANVYAVKSGNWSDTTVWNTGALPTADDDVFSNNFTVTVDQNIDVLSLRNSAAAPIVAGGTFNFNTADIIANVNSIGVGANIISITATSGLVTINSTVGITGFTNPLINHSGACNFTLTLPQLNINSASTGTLLIKSSTGVLTINGNLTWTSAANSISAQRLLTNSSGGVIINGNVDGGASGAGGSQITILDSSGGSLIINGYIYGRGGNNLLCTVVSKSAGTLEVNGPIVAWLAGSPAVSFVGNVATINGDVSGSGTSGISLTGASTVNITGNLYGGSTYAINATAAAIINIVGDVYDFGVGASNVGATVIVSGSLYNTTGRQAVFAPRLFLTAPSMQARFNTPGSQDIIFYSEDTVANYPSASNVRQGTVYGVASGSTGTLAIPASQDVRSGVAVDNTTGSGLFTTALLLSEISSSSTPVAARIRNAGTVEVLGEMLEAFKR